MSERRWDAELDELLAADPETWRLGRVMKASRLRPAPLDPRFKQDLRRRLMEAAYDHLGERPSLWSRIFGAPGLALAAAAVGAFALVAALYVLHLGPTGTNSQVTIGNSGPVAVNDTVKVKFSQPVPQSQQQQVEQGIQIQPATQVKYTWTSPTNLVITPVDGSFAGDTQYHVIVPAATATGTSKQSDLTFRTQPAPSPAPSAVPTPAVPSLAIISNRSLGAAKLLVGWTSQHQLVYITAGGDLDAVGADGSGSHTLATGVNDAALSTDGTQVLFVVGQSKIEQIPAAGGSAQTLGSADDVLAVYWLAAKPAFVTDGGLFSVDGGKLGATGLPSPDGGKLLVQSPSATSEIDLASGATHAWASPGRSIAWSPDSTRVAYSTGDATFVSAPEGSGAKQVLPVAGEPRWADAQTLFVNSTGGTFLVGADGSNRIQLSAGPVGSGAVFDGSTTLAALADGAADVLKIGLGTGLDLQAGNAVVKAFEDARVGGDAATAGSKLDASAARNAPPLVVSGQPHLSRWFPISAQAVANNPAYLRYVVRLIYSKDGQEVRWQDETLTLIAGSGGGLVIDAISDTATTSLTGPQVIGVQVLIDRVIVVFDSDLDAASVAGAFHVFSADGKEVPVKATYSARTVTLTVSLAAGRHYTLAVDATLRDVAGGSPAATYRQDLFGPPLSPSPST